MTAPYHLTTAQLKMMAKEQGGIFLNMTKEDTRVIPAGTAMRSFTTQTNRLLTGKTACSYNIIMVDLKFTWDPKKASSNLKRHGISFDEARSVFLDEYAIEYFDETHSEEEDRFLLLGLSALARLLLICHCYRESERTIRIISARKATKSESEHYRRR